MKTLKQQLEDAAVSADLNPRASQLLRDFFLKVATKADKDELDQWLNASDANSDFFDLLLEANNEGTNTAAIALIIKYTKKPIRKKSWLKRILWALLGFSLVMLLINHLLPSHPMDDFLSGAKFGESTLGLDSVSTGTTGKTVWLVDSTRVDLGPGSKIRYPNELAWHRRKIQVFGQATIYMQRKTFDDFLVVYGNIEERFNKDYRITCDSTKLIIQPLNP